MPFITVVPAIRTIPGVEEFDYAIGTDTALCAGDVIRVPFRKKELAALIIEIKNESAFAAKAILLARPQPLLRLGSAAATLLRAAAERTFTSKPTVFGAWIRTVPKRATPLTPEQLHTDATQAGMPLRETRYLLNRWHDATGLLSYARSLSTRVLIVTPWQHRAELLAKELSAPVLHGEISPAAAWKILSAFSTEKSTVLVTTRVGAWLSCIADAILIDEPENDDHKQDDLSPRIDARWLIETCASQRPMLSVVGFATTPRLSRQGDAGVAPTITLQLSTEQKQRRGSSTIEGLSARAVDDIQQHLEQQLPVTIIHAVSGDRARVVCRDCGWMAHCTQCGFPLSAVEHRGLCRSCGRTQDLPHSCPECQGTDFTRSSVGRDRLAENVLQYFHNPLIRVLSVAEIQNAALPRNGLVIITEFSLLSGAVEDTRRRERLLIAWRRLAAAFAASQSTVLVQGQEEQLQECREWLMSEGVIRAWNKERAERTLFGYPPATHLIKILVDESEALAQSINEELQQKIPKDWRLHGPYPVPYRAKTRNARWVIQLTIPRETPTEALYALLNPLKSRAIIDLDPVAFFA